MKATICLGAALLLGCVALVLGQRDVEGLCDGFIFWTPSTYGIDCDDEEVVLARGEAQCRLVLQVPGNAPCGAPAVSWSQTGGPAAATFAAPSSRVTTVRMTSPGTYVFAASMTYNTSGCCYAPYSLGTYQTVRVIQTTSQVPGDLSQDGALDISDCIAILGYLFHGKPAALPCGDGTLESPGNMNLVDVNDDTTVDVSDAIYVLGFLFLGGAPPVLGQKCVSMPGCDGTCAS